MQRIYKELIFTDHALERLKEREIKQSDAWVAWRSPDKSRFSESRGGRVFTKTFNGQEIEIVAKKNDKGKWLVISAWSRGVQRPKGSKKQGDGLFTDLIRRIFNSF